MSETDSNNPRSDDPNAAVLGPKWLSGPLGQHLLAREEALVRAELEQVFGFQLLQVGAWGAPNAFVRHSKTLRHSVLGDETCLLSHESAPAETTERARRTVIHGVDFIGSADALPVASDSVDAVILPHTLELHPHPHQILREVQRVLVGEGQLIVLGFSPISLWGLRQHALPGIPGLRVAPKQSVLTQHRLSDWLRLLGLDLTHSEQYFFAPPIQHEAVLSKTAAVEQWGRRWWPFFNGAYMLRAKKSLLRAATVGPRWHRRRRVVGGLADAATRSADGVTKLPK